METRDVMSIKEWRAIVTFSKAKDHDAPYSSLHVEVEHGVLHVWATDGVRWVHANRPFLDTVTFSRSYNLSALDLLTQGKEPKEDFDVMSIKTVKDTVDGLLNRDSVPPPDSGFYVVELDAKKLVNLLSCITRMCPVARNKLSIVELEMAGRFNAIRITSKMFSAWTIEAGLMPTIS